MTNSREHDNFDSQEMLAKRGDEGLFSTVECSINLCIIDHRLGQEHKSRHSSNRLQALSYEIILTDCMEGPLSMDTDAQLLFFDSILSLVLRILMLHGRLLHSALQVSWIPLSPS